MCILTSQTIDKCEASASVVSLWHRKKSRLFWIASNHLKCLRDLTSLLHCFKQLFLLRKKKIQFIIKMLTEKRHFCFLMFWIFRASTKSLFCISTKTWFLTFKMYWHNYYNNKIYCNTYFCKNTLLHGNLFIFLVELVIFRILLQLFVWYWMLVPHVYLSHNISCML